MPFAYNTAKSDLFLEDSGDDGSREAISNPMTDMAFKQCNDYIKSELGEKFTISFSSAPINTWGLGNYEYLINADVNINTNNSPAKTERYACRIQYDKSNDNNDTANNENWSIIGVSGIDDL